jgi:hypothetical protein
LKTTLRAFLLSLCAAVPVAASIPRIWVTDSTSDFSAGVAHGVSAAAGGFLRLSRHAQRMPGVAAPTILCAVEEKSGAVVLGTGDEGKVFRQERGREATILATLPEKEVTALAVGPDGAVYAATSPHGKIYRIEKGRFTVYADPKAEFLWALAFSGRVLYAGAGAPAKIFRIEGAGSVTEYLNVQDDHVRCLLVDRRGRLWAGTSGKGRILRAEGPGRAVTIHDSAKPEISALAQGPGDEIWAAAASARPAAGGGGPPRAAPPKEKRTEPAVSGDGGASVTVTVSASPAGPPLPLASGSAGESSELYEIAPDDSVATVWNSEEELVYSIEPDAHAGGVFLGTGPRGRLYFVQDRVVSLAQSFDEKRVLVMMPDAAVTDSAAGLYRFEPALAGDYVSAVKDTGRVSRFGAFRAEALVPPEASLGFAFRSGNSAVPDATWSGWSAVARSTTLAAIPAPAGRFLQWKAQLASKDAGISPRIQRVECAFRNRNSSPRVESVSALPAGVVEGTLAAASAIPYDESETESIFTGLDEKALPPAAGKTRRRGFLTIVWKASDPDSDELAYELEFRPEGAPRWVPMRKNLKATRFAFDSSVLPDGRYRFRVTASDAGMNPDDPRTDSRASDPVVIDNTPPSIEVISAEKGRVRLRITDASSPLSLVEWSVDAGAWIRAVSDDGMTDSPSESYTIALKPETRGAFLLVHASDAAGNVVSRSIALP